MIRVAPALHLAATWPMNWDKEEASQIGKENERTCFEGKYELGGLAPAGQSEGNAHTETR
jgi:hypothetical protein